MRTVYLLRSAAQPKRRYVGVTGNLQHRLKEHNAGRSAHTSKYAPWILVVAVQFADRRKANEFERYLKTGSGRVFAKRHFEWTSISPTGGFSILPSPAAGRWLARTGAPPCRPRSRTF